MLSICIPSWNTRELLGECLQSLQAHCRRPYEVIVVDNGSTDHSADMVAREFPQAILIRNRENRGFAAATNQAIIRATGRFIVLLNSDTRLDSDALGETKRFLEGRPCAGAAAPLLRRPNGNIQRSWGSLPGFRTELARALLLDRFAGRPWNGTRNLACRVDNLMGACLVLRREALDHIGLLDEGFVHYGEDVDLCWRLREAGWELYLLPWLEITHCGAASSRRMRREMWLNLHRSKCRLFRKHLGAPAVVGTKLLLSAEALAKGIGAMLLPTPTGRRKAKDCAALLRQIGGF